MYPEVTHSIGTLIVICVVYVLIPHQWIITQKTMRPRVYQLLSGLIFGALGIAVMMTVQTSSIGIRFDTRSVILCVAGVVGGPVIAGVAAMLCALYWLLFGGVGVLVGICVIAQSACFGSVYYYLRRRNPRLNGALPLWAFGVLVQGSMLLLMLILTGGIDLQILTGISIPLLLLFPISIMIICRIFFEFQDKRKSEDALRQSEQNYRELVELGGSIIVRWKLDGTITFVNKNTLILFGFSREELLGQSLLRIMFPENEAAEEITHMMVRYVIDNSDNCITHEREHVRSDGSRVWVNWTGRGLRDSSGAVVEILSIGFDCTERKQAEANFLKSEEQNRIIVETVNEGIWFLDCTFSTIFTNPKICELLGYAAQDMLGRLVDDFMHPEEIAGCAEMMADCMQGKSNLFQQRFVRCDGSDVWTLVCATPVMEQGRFNGLFFMVTDISELRQLHIALQQSEEKYHTLFKNMSQGVFYQTVDGTLTDVNPAALKMLGLTSKEFLGRTSCSPAWNVICEDGSRLSPEERPSMVALKTGEPVTDSTIGIFNESRQKYAWFNVNAVPRFNPDEADPYDVFVTMHDMSSYHEAQEALLLKQQQIDLLLHET